MNVFHIMSVFKTVRQTNSNLLLKALNDKDLKSLNRDHDLDQGLKALELCIGHLDPQVCLFSFSLYIFMFLTSISYFSFSDSIPTLSFFFFHCLLSFF